MRTVNRNASGRTVRPHTAAPQLPFPSVYHTASTIHKTPGRHIPSSVICSRPESTKAQLVRVESAVLLGGRTSPVHEQSSLSRERQHRVVPISKLEGEKILFQEVFIAPKEEQFQNQLSNLKLPLLGQNSAESFSWLAQKVDEVREQRTFFNFMIEVQPPEGLNVSAAAPLRAGGGWAPSFPAQVRSLK